MKKLVILTALFLSFSVSAEWRSSVSPEWRSGDDFYQGFTWSWDEATAANIKQAIAAGADVNAPDSINYMPLHFASWHSSINVVNALIAAGADVNAKINDEDSLDGKTPLHMAMINTTPDNLDIIKALIAAGADVNVKNMDYGYTPLMYFVRRYNNEQLNPIKVVKTLIAAGADLKTIDRYGLPLVRTNNFPEMNKVLINSGALVKDGLVLEPTLTKNTNTNANTDTNTNTNTNINTNTNTDINTTNKDGETSLHLAVINDDLALIKDLIAKGADLNAKNKHGRTPLDYAEFNDNNQIINTLKNSQSGKKSSSDYVRTPSVNDCVSIPARKNDYDSSRRFKNNCNFHVKLWYCRKNYKHGCGTSKGLIDKYINSSEGHRNQVFGYTRFHALVELSAGKELSSGASWESAISYFTCKGRHSHIVNNKKGETKFGCRTRKNLLDKYGFN